MHPATGSPSRLQGTRETITRRLMENTHHPSGSPWRNFYGRFKGKTLRPAQIEALDEDLDRLSVPNVSWDVNPDRTQLDLQALFAQKDLWLEIGFGGGEHLVHQAQSNPDVGIIGCEPFLNGVAMLLQKCAKRPVKTSAFIPAMRVICLTCCQKHLCQRHFCSILTHGPRSAIIGADL